MIDPFGGFNQSLANLGQSLQQQTALERQTQQDAQAKQLQDLAIQSHLMELAKAKREQEYQTGLEAAMSKPATISPATGGFTKDTTAGNQNTLQLFQNGAGMIPLDSGASPIPEDTGMTGFTPKQPTLADLAPQSIIQPQTATGEAVPFQPEVKKSPMQTGAEYALSKGRPQDAEKFNAYADAQKQREAQFSAYGGEDAKYKADALAEKFKTFGSVAKNVENVTGGKQILKQAGMQLFPGLDASAFDFKDDSVIVDLTSAGLPGYKGLKVAGKPMELIKPEKPVETWGEPYTEKVGGKIVKLQKSSTGQIKPVVQDASTTVHVQSGGSMTSNAIDLAADQYLLTGQLPALGMGSAKSKEAILNKAAEKAKAQGLDASGIVTEIAVTKANAGNLAQQQKQVGAMGSFVKNIDKQVNRFETLSKELASFDTRLLNVPLRQVRGRIAGSPNQAKLDMYLTEISSETGKLASGATSSVAELSQGAREKWEKIHDPNLSMADLLSLLKETRHAGQMRMQSVQEQINETKTGMQNRGKTSTKSGGRFTIIGVQ